MIKTKNPVILGEISLQGKLSKIIELLTNELNHLVNGRRKIGSSFYDCLSYTRKEYMNSIGRMHKMLKGKKRNV